MAPDLCPCSRRQSFYKIVATVGLSEVTSLRKAISWGTQLIFNSIVQGLSVALEEALHAFENRNPDDVMIWAWIFEFLPFTHWKCVHQIGRGTHFSDYESGYHCTCCFNFDCSFYKVNFTLTYNYCVEFFYCPPNPQVRGQAWKQEQQKSS